MSLQKGFCVKSVLANNLQESINGAVQFWMHKSSVVFSEVIRELFFYTEVCILLDFSILSLIIKQQIQRRIGTSSALLIIKSGFLPRVKHMSFRILTSKHSAGLLHSVLCDFQGTVYFARGALYF